MGKSGGIGWGENLLFPYIFTGVLQPFINSFVIIQLERYKNMI